MSVEYVFSVEVTVRGYHEYQNVGDAPIKILSCEIEVSNIHDTFAAAITMDGKGLHCCGSSLSE